jgi:hypothetical protein
MKTGLRFTKFRSVNYVNYVNLHGLLLKCFVWGAKNKMCEYSPREVHQVNEVHTRVNPGISRFSGNFPAERSKNRGVLGFCWLFFLLFYEYCVLLLTYMMESRCFDMAGVSDV